MGSEGTAAPAVVLGGRAAAAAAPSGPVDQIVHERTFIFSSFVFENEHLFFFFCGGVDGLMWIWSMGLLRNGLAVTEENISLISQNKKWKKGHSTGGLFHRECSITLSCLINSFARRVASLINIYDHYHTIKKLYENIILRPMHE